jgi:CBS domain-containing protein
MSQVRDIINNRDLFSVDENQTVAEVVRRMAELQVGAILVLQDDQLRGIFSERDLLRRVVLEQMDPQQTAVRQVMSINLATVDETVTLEQAMAAMQTHSCRHLPVMRGPRVVGFLSMRDLMNEELTRQTEELHHMRAYIHGS